MLLTIGADPEFFLRKDGEFVSAHDIVPGNKHKPWPLSHGAVQADGTAVEFNITPAKTAEQFTTNIRNTLIDIRKMVPKEYEFCFIPAIEYQPGYFDKLPVKFKRLGCDPDFNAWEKGQVNPKPKDVGTLRAGAGHLHLGWGKGFKPTPDHIWDCCEMVKVLDNTLGIAAKFWDNDRKRALLYGKPGAFRPKPYGVEYRVLSNKWLCYPDLWPWLFDTVQKCFSELVNKGRAREFYKGARDLANFNWQYRPADFTPIPQLKEDMSWLSLS